MSHSPEVEKALQEIYDRDGQLTPDAVISAAQDPDSPLHGHFDWDVESAAMNHWRHVARRLITSVKLDIRTETYTLKSVAYTRDPDKEGKDQGYTSVVSLRDDKDRARRSVMAELRRADAAMNRAYDLAFALGLQSEIEAIRSKIDGILKAA